jgi:peptidoglycan/LPS O-acetylase OafA/YrhL
VFLFHYYNIDIGLAGDTWQVRIAALFRGAGYLGVDFFFTLSGFLITAILLTKKGFDLSGFYARRILRILPLYILIVVAAYLVLPLALGQSLNLPPLMYVLSFTANYFYALHGDHYLFAITLLWSISVEMQFYLLWGAVLRFLRSYLYLVMIVVTALSLLVKYFLYGKCSLYYLSATYIPDFMAGAAGAKLLYDHVLKINSIHKGARLTLYLIALAIFIFMPFLNTFFWWKIFGNCIYSALAIGIILDQISEGSLFEAGRIRLFSYLGRVSYGIYCFQGFVLPLYSRFLLSSFIHARPLITALLAPLALFSIMAVAAVLSYRFFESYFLRVKVRM